MKREHQTWYILGDGTLGDPNDVTHDEKGVLRHKSGAAVALRDNGDPMTTSRDRTQKVEVPAVQEVAQTDEKLVAAVVLPAPGATATDETKAPKEAGVDPKVDENLAKEVKPEPAKTYKTRETKSR